MELHFLGTGAGVPSKKRNTTAIVLRLTGAGGRLWMFDCGEGTQQQLLKSPLKLSKLDKLFVTHLHGDHIFGIPGLLSSRSFQGGTGPLTVYGPAGIRRFIDTAMHLSDTHLPYALEIIEIGDGARIEAEGFTIVAGKLHHNIDSFGYRITEKDTPGPLQVARLKSLGLPPGPLYGKIKRGETVRLPDGRTIDGRDYIGPLKRGRVVTILGDTRPCEAAVALSRGADVLVHEATFAEAERALAADYEHSTAAQAAQVAKEADAAALILTHISPRYDADAGHLLEEARHIFAHAHIAEDMAVYAVPR